MYETLKTQVIRNAAGADGSVAVEPPSSPMRLGEAIVRRKTITEASACPARRVATLLALQADLPTMIKQRLFVVP